MFGVHIDSDPNKITEQLLSYKNKGCSHIQLFIDPFFKKRDLYYEFGKKAKQNNMNIIVHLSYVINCAQNWDLNSWWIKETMMEIISANKISAQYAVIHLGKMKELSVRESMNNMFTSLIYIHEKTKDTNVKILLETSSGQGSEMCYTLEDLSLLYKKFSKHKSHEIRDRFGICLDTCHIFAAGYDISDVKKIDKVVKKIDDLIGIKNIKLIHLNDSKNEMGSKKDRHENIGHGFIGKNQLKKIINIFGKKNKIPCILETPLRYIEDDIKIIKKELKA